MPDPTHEEGWVAIARVARTHGRKGELSVIPLTSHPERFEQLGEVLIAGAIGFPNASRRYAVEGVWSHRDRIILKLEGVDSISEAEPLREGELRVPVEQRFRLPEDEYYQSDLIGCEVVLRESGQLAGRVTGFLELGPNGLLQVAAEGSGKELLVPFAGEICVVVDVEAKRIVIDPPEGLLELNG